MEIGPLNFVFAAAGTAVAYWLVRHVQRAARVLRQLTNPIQELALTPLPDDVARPEPLADAERRLVALGFRRIRAQSAQVEAESTPRLLTTYIHDDPAIAALLQTAPAMSTFAVEFRTLYEDGALISTHYPIVLHKSTPDLHVRHARHSAEAAYQYHAEMMRLWTAMHGQPRAVDNLDEYIAESNAVLNRYGSPGDEIARRSSYAALAIFGGAAAAALLFAWLPVLAALLEGAGVDEFTAYNVFFYPLLIAAGTAGFGLFYSNRVFRSAPAVDESATGKP